MEVSLSQTKPRRRAASWWRKPGWFSWGRRSKPGAGSQEVPLFQAPPIDAASLHTYLAKLIESLAPDGVDEGIGPIFDTFIDALTDQLITELQVSYQLYLGQSAALDKAGAAVADLAWWSAIHEHNVRNLQQINQATEIVVRRLLGDGASDR
ncbi:hypothetical protein Aple_040430 [Acrocarpospora pleiomorpha]|uniref:Uncharacterized protein n=1 Tax=Acrocarpospora pleiomorpha TaxID=90975 RepID=A0A5M3XI12_9ACTN|nr:hypothetical protein [Acrocarpospora pleiomorpha]GES21147.1 hypothetical protein Aple_040430 [Acrocarpospora pleiomorpha]